MEKGVIAPKEGGVISPFLPGSLVNPDLLKSEMAGHNVIMRGAVTAIFCGFEGL